MDVPNDPVQTTGGAPFNPPTRLGGPWLTISRASWLIVTALATALFVLGIPPHYRAGFDAPEYAPEVMALLGPTTTFGAAYNLILDIGTVAVFLGIALLLFWRRSDDRLTLVASLMLVTWGTSNTTSIYKDLIAADPTLVAPVQLVRVLGDILVVAFVYTLPDGRFIPAWTRWIVAGFAVWAATSNLAPDLFAGIPLIEYLVPFAAYLGAFFVQRYRFRRVFTAEQVQQGKWILYGFIAALIGFMGTFLPGALIPALDERGLPLTIYKLVFELFLFFALAAAPLTIAFSIQRYRLWDIDRLFNRSLVFGAATALLVGFFFVIVLAVEALMRAITGQPQSPVAYAAGAVLVGITSQPLHRRLQRLIDRHLFSQQPEVDAPEASLDEPTAAGLKFGVYEARELIARGGMGEIYKGEHPTLGRAVAIKVLPASLAEKPEFRTRFEREARLVSNLRHSNIVSVFDFGFTGSVYYMVMEYINGRELRSVIRQRAPMPLDEVRQIVRDVGSALDYAHAQGLVHRDIKPSNIMLEVVTAGGGPQQRAVLLDFGIAKIVSGETVLTSHGMLGTLDYVAPEQILAATDVDGRADVYALGIIAYEMLTGDVPFQATSPGQVLFAHLNQPPPDLMEARPDIPLPVCEAVTRALAKQPDDRFPTAGEFALALNEAAAE